MRIGHGYDAHRYKEGSEITVGGVAIPCEFAMVAHSDGDVLAHAIADSLLGAAGLPDIGVLFPDTDDIYKGISSMLLLEEVVKRIEAKGFVIDYIDSTIVAQLPKMKIHIDSMKKTIAEHCKIKADRVNIKATTEEKMGFTGSLEGIGAHAVCILDERGCSSI